MQQPGKTHRIKKSPKPSRNQTDIATVNKKQNIFSTLSLTPQFGVFENQMQKQVRLQKFWKEQIDNYYKKNMQEGDMQLLNNIIQEEVPTLRDVIQNPFNVLHPSKVPFEELFRYVQLVRQIRLHHQSMILIENSDRQYIGIMEQGQLTKLIEVSLEQAFLAKEHHNFIQRLSKRQHDYNMMRGTQHKLSQISSQIAYLLYLMKQCKQKINESLKRLSETITNQCKLQNKPTQKVQDQYISHLFRKNLKIAVKSQQINYLNYFSNLDILEQYGSIDPEQTKVITDKKEFEEYMKRKKNKKTKKNPKGVLKTSCGGCLSSHHEQYNPFFYCFDCHIRFHKFCYTSIDGLCEPCFNRKNPQIKPRSIECQFCGNRGLLSLPIKTNRQGVFIHIFCMLINGLWKYENGSLQFQSGNFSAGNIINDQCTICNCGVYTYQCQRCPNRGHPLCAYLNGWNMCFDQNGKVKLQCCSPDLDKQKQSYRRKFMLNYKKFLYKSQKDR